MVAITVLTLLLAFGLSRDPTLIRSPLIGKPAPTFGLLMLDGTTSVRLGDLHGQVVVVNFWASWCADCRIEHGALAAAWDRYRDQRVVILLDKASRHTAQESVDGGADRAAQLRRVRGEEAEGAQGPQPEGEA